jgi:hypothetical protein
MQPVERIGVIWMEVNRVTTKCRSGKGCARNYVPLFSELLKERRDQPLGALELEFVTNNLDLSPKMGVSAG